MTNPWQLGWDAVSSLAAGAGLLLTGLSAGLAFVVFRRDALLREIEACHRLEQGVAAAWAKVKADGSDLDLTGKVRTIFDTYELAAQYLNSFRFLRGPASKGLEQAIVEVIEKALKKKDVSESVKACCTSQYTYCELRTLLERHSIILPKRES